MSAGNWRSNKSASDFAPVGGRNDRSFGSGFSRDEDLSGPSDSAMNWRSNKSAAAVGNWPLSILRHASL